MQSNNSVIKWDFSRLVTHAVVAGTEGLTATDINDIIEDTVAAQDIIGMTAKFYADGSIRSCAVAFRTNHCRRTFLISHVLCKEESEVNDDEKSDSLS